MDTPPDSTTFLNQTVDLLSRARGGNQDALDELFRIYGPRLRAFLRARMPASQRGLMDTQDLTQDVSLKVFTNLQRFEYLGVGSFWAYVRQIALNHVRDVGRKGARRGTPEPLDDGSHDALASPKSGPISGVMRREQFQAFDEALAVVDEKQRQALTMRIELDSDYETIAAECGYPSRDAARMSVKRALAQVTKEMARRGIE